MQFRHISTGRICTTIPGLANIITKQTHIKALLLWSSKTCEATLTAEAGQFIQVACIHMCVIVSSLYMCDSDRFDDFNEPGHNEPGHASIVEDEQQQHRQLVLLIVSVENKSV